MEKITNSLFLLVFCLIIPSCFTDLTGSHYLRTINCSSPLLYIPEGAYLFSHHWPFTSITIQYQKQINRGTCYRDGSLSFTLDDDKLCSGIYYSGQAKLLCLFENDAYCLMEMKTIDGSRLTCDGSRKELMTIGTVISFFCILFIHKNR
jgi:hypothetical protein